jgi:hypothetical protein
MDLELLENVIGLTHPDRHPPERAERAGRVTAELLAMRAWVRAGGEAAVSSTPGEVFAGDRDLHIPATARTISTSRIVTSDPCLLLSIDIVSVRYGSKLQIFDAKSATNPSTGEIEPMVGTRWLGIHHRTGIFARISGEMTLTFFFTR